MPTLLLLADASRGAEAPNDVVIPRGAGQVRVQAEIDASDTHARYVLSVADGAATVFVADALAPRQSGPYRFVEAVMPAAAFGADVRRIGLRAQGADHDASAWTVRARFVDR
ncbi:MAG TPA: hypothetical protein VGC30_02995 [Dokdonella sp.]